MNSQTLVASSGISFFPESRVKALSTQIGTNSMECLIDRISHLIRSRVDLVHPSQDINKICGDFKNPIEVEAAEARSFIDSEFQ